jgi:hypothetical protein
MPRNMNQRMTNFGFFFFGVQPSGFGAGQVGAAMAG